MPAGLPASRSASELRDADLAELTAAVVQRVRDEISGAASRFVPVAVSARHVHLTREVLDELYGRGYELTRERELSQPGEFAAGECVTLIGSRMRSIEGVRVLGPLRRYAQVELARTDGVSLGLELPVRESGNLSGSSPIVLVGPRGAVSLKEGAIRPARHIHATEKDAALMGLGDGQTVSARVRGKKGVVFENVIVKVRSDFRLEMHLDTDDANAADVCCDMLAEIKVNRGS
ncbi:MAG: phosphate propanoyltransferase [Candidatus Eiseniibacteriota bacterium]|nr:MAG: phosphate propanoyltransferase [Candidatus Eisenbacteria bacterium]